MRKLVVGLGNPGPEYEQTRHNVGFWVLDELARRRGLAWRDCCRAAFASTGELEAAVSDERVERGCERAVLDLAKPQTFMNRSGLSVRCLMEQFGYDVSNILVVFDDVALPLGRLRLRIRGSTGGHRGLASVIHQVRTQELSRLRFGILPEEPLDGELPEFVLAPFARGELERVEAEVQRAADCCESWAADGAQVAMNEYNRVNNE